MAWTTPKTWVAEELLMASDMNAQIRDNLNALKAPPTHVIERDNGAAYSTTSTSFVAVDSTNLKATLTTSGGAVWVHFTGTVHADQASNRHAAFDLSIDGGGAHYAGQGYANGYCGVVINNTTGLLINIDWLLTDLAAGEHTFALMWKTNAGTMYLHADTDDGTASNENPAVLWAREV